jgi:type IV secretory pathway TrbF-like protein
LLKKIKAFLKENSSTSSLLSQTTNPYIAARLEWNYLFSDIRRAKQHWKLATLISLIANLILCMGVVCFSHGPSLIPYVVKVDGLGNVVYGGKLDQKNTISPLEINAFLRQFISNAKSILADPFAQKRNVEFVYTASLPSVRKLLDSFYQSQNPFQTAKQELIEVQVKGVIQKSKRTWQINWIEIHRNLEGHILNQTQWEALITLGIHRISNPEILNSNPLGIFIEQMNWAEQV